MGPVAVTGCGPANGPTGTPSAPSAPTASGTADLASVLVRAVTEERKVKATYDNVLAALGAVVPFARISQAEAAHVAALERVARVHGVDVSGAKAVGDPSPRTLADACRLGVTDEEADVALYDQLLPQVRAYPDVAVVLTNLRAASQNSHLPAFRRCA
ncbi:ferritin-like domain-containing protein [Amycolatopsis nivea]